MTQKISDASVWFGAELSDRADWLVELKQNEINEIRHAVANATTIPLDEIDRSNFKLPILSKRLLNIQESLEHESGATLIRGFPLADFDEDSAAKAFFGISQYVGTPVSQSAAGERVFHVRDAGFNEDDPRARGPNTKKKLSFHTDRCDVIGFLCLGKAKSGGENYLVSSTAIFNQIADTHPELLNELMQPFFYQRHNVDKGNELAYCQQPVFSFCEERFACSFLRVLIDRAYGSGDVPPMTELQTAALDLLESTAEDPEFQHRFYQEPGDILFLNNWTTLHRRTEFVDHAEPERKRHLLRIWLSVPNSRPISPMFKDNFGATEAGAIRGGMRAASR